MGGYEVEKAGHHHDRLFSYILIDVQEFKRVD